MEREGVIDFDIVVPTEKGAIYACEFVRNGEIVASSTECGSMMSITMAHCLLGHRNEDSMR